MRSRSASLTAAVARARSSRLARLQPSSIGSVTPFRVAPGKYRVVVQSPVHNRFRGSEKDMTLDIAPCKRYYINAQFDNPVSPDWTPVVDYVETITGCKA